MIKLLKIKKLLIPLLAVLLLIDPFLGLTKAKAAGEADSPINVPKTVQEPGMDVSFSKRSDSPVELEQFRTANSKRILKPDGSMTEEVYLEPIHYKDEKTNKWQPIDATLVESNGKYKNKANQFSVSYLIVWMGNLISHMRAQVFR